MHATKVIHLRSLCKICTSEWYFAFSPAAKQGGTVWVQPVCEENPGTFMHVAVHGYIPTEIVIVEPLINAYFVAYVHKILQHIM
jgi:hypothetical protein